MLFKNECNHPEENYLFSMEIDGEQCDVWVVEDSCKLKCDRDHHEFCLRYGNEDHEYKSSWDCSLIERIICRRTQYLEDVNERRDIDQLIKLKARLQEAGYWDIEWNLDLEIIELQAQVKEYNDMPRFKSV
jgi:hypothetical protein